MPSFDTREVREATMPATYCYLQHKEQTLVSGFFVAVPRVGETVYYSCSLFDKEDWNQDALRRERILDGTEWRVTRVSHEMRRTRIQCVHASVYVEAEPVNEQARKAIVELKIDLE